MCYRPGTVLDAYSLAEETEKAQCGEQVNNLCLEGDSGQRKWRWGAEVRVGDRLGQSKTQGESVCATFEGGGERVVSHVEEQHSRQRDQGVQILKARRILEYSRNRKEVSVVGAGGRSESGEDIV